MIEKHAAKRWLSVAARLRSNPVASAMFRLLPPSLRARIRATYYGRAHRLTTFEKTSAWHREDSNTGDGSQASSMCSTGAAGVEVNVIGYFQGQFGLAEGARLYFRALMDAGVPISAVNVALDLPHAFEDRTFEGHLSPASSEGVDLVCVNPDYLDEALAMLPADRNAVRVASWFWELERIPATWLAAIDRIDEIVVASEFVQRAFLDTTTKPVHCVPLPVYDAPASSLRRNDFGLPEDAFVFLVAFDFNSGVERKNPHAAIAAFRQAFDRSRKDAILLIKSSNGHRHLAEFEALLAAGGDDPRIMIRDETIERRHLAALQQCCDVFVSLHRAEGFGLHLAECMKLGKPVIATNWSGNTTFMSSSNSCLVDYALVPVPEGAYPFSKGLQWAEPDIGHAAAFMRKLADESTYREGIGEGARATIGEILDPHAIAMRLHVVLECAKSSRETGRYRK